MHHILSARLLSKDVKIEICRTVIVPVVLYGCETWSVTLRGKHRLIVFENRVLRKLIAPTKDEVAGEGGEDYLTRSFTISTSHRMLFG